MIGMILGVHVLITRTRACVTCWNYRILRLNVYLNLDSNYEIIGEINEKNLHSSLFEKRHIIVLRISRQFFERQAKT